MVLFTVKANTMILHHDFIKKLQKTPSDDLATARRRLADIEKE